MTVGLLATLLVLCSSEGLSEPGPDEPPVWTELPGFEAVEDEPFTLDLSANVSDPDTPPANITLDSPSPYVVDIDHLNVTCVFPNGVLEANVTLVASDGNSTATTVAHFIVEPVNDPPRWKEVKLPDGEQDSFYSFNLTATDPDNDDADLTYSTDATFFIMSAASPEIAFTPTNDHVGYNRFNVTVSDPDGLKDVMELVLFVENVPDGPWWRYIPPQTARVGLLFSLDVSDFVEDPDLLLPPEFRDRITYTDDSTKLETDAETGLVTWTPTNADVGDHFFTLTITDSKGRSDQQEIRITVPDPGPGPPPVIGPQVLTQGVRYVFDIPMDDWYYQNPEFHEGMEFSNEPTDLFRVDPYTGRIDLVPGNEDVGEWEVDLIVTDSFGLESTRTVEFTVLNVNDPPVLVPMSVLLLTEGEPAIITLEARDPDTAPRRVDPDQAVDPDERLTFSGGPPGATVDPATGISEFVPDQGHANASPMDVWFTVEDARGSRDTIHVQIHVRDVVVSPHVAILGLVDQQKLIVDRRYTVAATSWDETGEPWAEDYKWYSGTDPIGTGASCSWSPPRIGHYQLTLVGRNGDGTTAEDEIVVAVEEGPSPPGARDRSCLVGVVGLVIAVLMALNYRSMAWQRDQKER